MTQIFISHTSKAGPQVRAFLEVLPDALRKRGLEPFLDSDGLRAGYAWRPVLYRKLAECEGAVLALGPDALQRDWVRQEATILSWRRALRAYAGHTMPVVAVLLDGLTRQEMVDAFPALNLGETEVYRTASETVEAAVKAGLEVADIFPGSVASRADDPMQWWTQRVGAWLSSVHETFLDQVGRLLEIAKEDWDPRYRCNTIADSLLHATTFDAVENTLEEIKHSGGANAREVVNAVLPVAIPAATAQVLLAAMCEEPGQRVVALNTFVQDLGELFVQRATCCDKDVLIVRTPIQVTGDEDSLYAEVVSAIGQKAGARPPESFKPKEMALVRKRVVVVLQCSDKDGQGLPHVVLQPLLTRLRHDFPTCAYVVLSGPRYTDDLDVLVPRRLRAEPPMGDEAEQNIRRFAINRLRDEPVLRRSA